MSSLETGINANNKNPRMMSESKLPIVRGQFIDATCEQNIIDYPRHIKFSSKFESVAQI